MPNTKVIPIFPLDLVLFPRQELPLRIFEPRYKQLVDDCMLGDGQFGVCLIDGNNSLNGWSSPKLVGTVAKILKCKDTKLDGSELHIETVGRNSFKIQKIIPSTIPQPANYDPHSMHGLQEISELHESSGIEEKMYMRAQVEMVPEIDENVTSARWEKLVELWKKQVIRHALPQVVDPHSLDHLLKQYYLDTVTPTIDYVYSLSALGAKDPNQLQDILEATTMDELLIKVEALLQ